MEILSEKMVLDILHEHSEYFHSGELRDVDFRIKQLNKLLYAVKDNEEELLKALKIDLGKSEFESYASEIGYVYSSIRHMIKHLKSWAKPKKVGTPLFQVGAKGYIYSEPYGTVLIIGPYNYPFELVFEPLLGSMAAGNCTVIKPAQTTPNVSKVIKKIISDNFEERYIRVVEGNRNSTAFLINAPFDYIFFTGSVKVGKIVMEAASRNLVPVTLELGGKSPCIIDKTAKLDVVLKRVVWGKFFNAGQTCICPDYLIIHKDIKKEVIKRMKDIITDFYGNNIKESSDLGRIVNFKQMDRLADIIEKDKSKIVFGGSYDKETRYIEPTLIDNATYDDASMMDEIFGPILPMMEYDDIDEVIKMINVHPKPLALYLFSEDVNIQNKVLERTSSGGCTVNDTLSHYMAPNLPFGGVGNSGMGAYHGKETFNTFCHKKSVLKSSTTFNNNLSFPPYEGKIKLLRKIFK